MGGCILADAGYKLFRHVMTPYAIYFGMPSDEAKYNLLHSRTRIIVEQAFGRWKNTFRLFKTELIHDTPEEMAFLIEATLILHNWLIDLNGDYISVDIQERPWMHIGGDPVAEDKMNAVDGIQAQNCRDRIKEYLSAFI
jgi:hypothetical protein